MPSSFFCSNGRSFMSFTHACKRSNFLESPPLSLTHILYRCLKALVGILTEIHEDALRQRNSPIHITILEAASLFTALLLRDPPQDAQPLLVEAFALSGSINSDHAVACVLSRITDASLPPPPLLLAAASCAALCGSKFDPHMPVILSKILPCLSVAKSDGTRAVIATLAARFSECAASSRCKLPLRACAQVRLRRCRSPLNYSSRHRAAGGSVSCGSELGIIFDTMVCPLSSFMHCSLHHIHVLEGTHLAAVA